MRKILSLLAVMLLTVLVATAQTRPITGRVTDEQGKAVEGASVLIKGTSTGAAADNQGNFRISAKTGDVLVISAVGFSPKEFPVTATTNSINAGLTRNVVIDEVVVTALGLRRKPQEVGYATATVTPEQITASKSFNLAQSLSGKVSGLTITNTSASVNGTPRIVLRGLRSILGDNTALIVLDGIPVPSNTINYINPNDVERIDILKGGQAAALFGTEGTNGAISITTKKGTNKRPEINIGISANVESVAYMPKFNTTFGSGSGYGTNPAENFHPAENQQYGDHYDGSIRPAGRVLEDGSIMLLPYSYTSKSRDGMYRDGVTPQIDLSYRAGDANSNFFASYQNVHSDGIVVGDKYDRNSFRMNAGRTYGKLNVSFDATYTWDHSNRTSTDFYFFALNTPSWIPLADLKDWRTNKFASMNGYFNDYYNNPWWLLDNNRTDSRNNYFNGNLTLTYKANQNLEFRGRAAIASTDATATGTANTFSFSTWARSRAFLNYSNNDYDRLLTNTGRYIANNPNIVPGGMSESQSNGTRINTDLLATYSKTFGNISLKAVVGGAARISRSKSFAVSMNGIQQPDLYNFANTVTGLYTGSNGISETRKVGAFADVTFGYKNYFFIEGIFRNDYTSVFYDQMRGFDKPNYQTYGVDGSFILTNIFPSIKSDKLTNAKLRLGYNRNGNDNLGAYSLAKTYPNASGFPYSGLLGSTVSSTEIAPDLAPEIVKSTEVGLELGFFKNRLTIEGSYYVQNSDKQIISTDISNASGYQNYLLNAASVQNKGYEIDVKANVWRNRNWNISANVNYSHNKNEVKSIYQALQAIVYQSSSIVSLNAEVGQMFPYLKTTAFERDPQGHVVIDANDGWPNRAADFAGQGTTLPIHVLGTGFSVSYKAITLTANAEYRGGNVVFHNIGSDMTFTGSSALTTIYNRDQFVWPNSVYKDGTGKYVTNTNIAVSPWITYYSGYGDQGFSRGMSGTGEVLVSSGAFWKLRDVNLTYEMPSSVMRHLKGVKGISITAWARNLITLLPKDNWFTDPEFSNTNGNSTGINTSLNTPPTRQIGGALRVTI